MVMFVFVAGLCRCGFEQRLMERGCSTRGALVEVLLRRGGLLGRDSPSTRALRTWEERCSVMRVILWRAGAGIEESAQGCAGVCQAGHHSADRNIEDGGDLLVLHLFDIAEENNFQQERWKLFHGALNSGAIGEAHQIDLRGLAIDGCSG